MLLLSVYQNIFGSSLCVTIQLCAVSRVLCDELHHLLTSLLPAFSDKSIDSLKISDYQEFINTLTLLDGTSPSKNLHNIIDIIHSFLKWSYENEFLYNLYCRHIGYVGSPPHGRTLTMDSIGVYAHSTTEEQEAIQTKMTFSTSKRTV